MADLALRMTLTLADAASGPLRGFTALLDSMRAATAGLDKQLDRVAAGITRVSTGTARADSTTAGLTGAMMSLEAALAGVAGRLTATAAGLGAVAAEGRAAGAGVAAGAASMTAGMATANTQASTLMQTLKGLVMLYAAAKIKDGFVAAGGAAMDYETSRARASGAGLSASELSRVDAAATSGSRAVPQFDRGQAFNMAMDLRSTMNDLPAALAILPEMLRFAYVLKSQSKDGKVDPDILRDTGKFLQQRSAITDPTKRVAEIDNLTRIITANPSVNVKTMLTNLTQMKGAVSGDNVAAEFLPVLAALAEMVPAQGGQIGTQLTTLARTVMGITKNGISAKAVNELGLFEDPKGLQWNSLGNIDLKKSNLRMKGASLFQENPLAWVEQVLIPAMQSKGMDVNDTRLVADVMSRVFGARNAAEIAQTMVNKRGKLRADADMTAGAQGSEAQYKAFAQTAQGRWDAVTGQFRDLATVLGEQLLPVIKEVSVWLKTAAQSLSDFFTKYPALAQFALLAAAITGVGLAIAGMMGLFGLAASGLGIFGAANATATTVAGGAWKAFGVDFGAVASKLGTALKWLGGVFLAAFVGWELGSVLARLKVGGQEVSTWIADWAEAIVNRIQNTWDRAKGWLASLFGGANAAANAVREIPIVGAGSTASPANVTKGAKVSGVVTPYMTAGDFARMDHDRTAVAAAGSFNTSEPPGKTTKSGSKAALAERFSLSAIRSAPELYKADFLRSEKGAYDIKDAPGPSASDLDKLELQVKRDLLMTAGQRREAEALRIKAELDGDLKKLVLAGRITQAEADQASARAAAAVELRQMEADQQIRGEAYRAQLIAIDAAERNGTITDLDATRQKIALRKQEAAAADVLLRKELALAEASGNEGRAAQLRTALAQNNATLGELPPEMTAVLKSSEQGFTTFFSSILNGTKSVKGAFGSLILSINQTMNDLIAKELGNALFKSLFGDMGAGAGGGGGLFGSLFSGGGGGGGAGGGFGGLLGKLFSGGSGGGFLGSLFGNAAGSPSSAGFGTGAGFGNLDFGGFFADGTDYIPRDMMVGVHEGERITPKAFNPAAGYAGGGRGGPAVINQAITINAPGGIDRSTAGQLAARMARAARTESTRGTAG